MPAAYNGADVAFLVGGRLQQLALGIHEFQLAFDVEAKISIHQTITIETRSDSREVRADNPTQTKELVYLLGSKIIDAEIDATKSLKLVFDNQSRISIPASANAYDSYVIWSKGGVITG